MLPRDGQHYQVLKQHGVNLLLKGAEQHRPHQGPQGAVAQRGQALVNQQALHGSVKQGGLRVLQVQEVVRQAPRHEQPPEARQCAFKRAHVKEEGQQHREGQDLPRRREGGEEGAVEYAARDGDHDGVREEEQPRGRAGGEKQARVGAARG